MSLCRRALDSATHTSGMGLLQLPLDYVQCPEKKDDKKDIHYVHMTLPLLGFTGAASTARVGPSGVGDTWEAESSLYFWI